MYDELVKHLRFCGKCNDAMECDYCEYNNTTEYVDRDCSDRLMLQAADAIKELQEDNAALNGTVSNLIQQIEELSKRVPPVPHGRLGDLDELEKTFREDADAEWNRFASPVNWADAFDDVANIVADAPTILEAEEGE